MESESPSKCQKTIILEPQKCLGLLSFAEASTLSSLLQTSHEWRKYASRDDLWFNLSSKRWSGTAPLLKSGLLAKGTAMSWFKRRHLLEANRLVRSKAKAAIYDSPSEAIKSYKLLVEFKTSNEKGCPSFFSGLFDLKQAQHVQDASSDANHCRAPVKYVNKGEPILVESLQLTITVVRVHDGRCMSLCMDAPVVDHDEGYIYMDTCEQGSMLVPPHLADLFRDTPSDLTPQICLENPTYEEPGQPSAGSESESGADTKPLSVLKAFESISLFYWNPLSNPDSGDLSVLPIVKWIGMWENAQGAWV